MTELINEAKKTNNERSEGYRGRFFYWRAKYGKRMKYGIGDRSRKVSGQ